MKECKIPKKSWTERFENMKKRVPDFVNKKGFRKWFFDNEKNGWLFDIKLVQKCFNIYSDMKNKDKDHFTLIVGGEGFGKSTLSLQMCSWIDPEFTVQNVCFTPKDYIRQLKILKKGSCILLDEGGVALYSREAMGINNIGLTKLFMLQRQKNISCFVVCPSFWDIDTYIRRHRINTLIRVIKQGQYMGMLRKSIDIINEVGYRKKPLTHIKLPNGFFWHGYFAKQFPKQISREAYLKRKQEHLNEFLDSLDKDEFEFMPAIDVAKRLSITPKQMRWIIAQGNIKAKKVGRKWFIPKLEVDKALKP